MQKMSAPGYGAMAKPAAKRPSVSELRKPAAGKFAQKNALNILFLVVKYWIFKVFCLAGWGNMIPVTKLDGSTYWINPHMIESMEQNPDLTVTFFSGKKIVVKDKPQEVIDRIVSYRKQIGINAIEI